MSSVTYTAKRSIIGGHTEDTSYDFDVTSLGITRQSKSKKTLHRSLDGTSETTFNNQSIYLNITLGNFSLSERPEVLEFLDSVSGGESFAFDEYGTAASPDNPVTCILEGDYAEIVVSQKPIFRFSFKALVIS